MVDDKEMYDRLFTQVNEILKVLEKVQSLVEEMSCHLDAEKEKAALPDQETPDNPLS